MDKVRNWQRLYGNNGFLQYQFIIPKKTGKEAIYEILNFINTSKNSSSLAVLKLHGKNNNNYISFPISGYSLAMDFAINDDISKILNKIDQIVLKFEGRVYLTKDSRLEKVIFKKFYPNFTKIKKVIEKYEIYNFSSFQSKRLGMDE